MLEHAIGGFKRREDDEHEGEPLELRARARQRPFGADRRVIPCGRLPSMSTMTRGRLAVQACNALLARACSLQSIALPVPALRQGSPRSIDDPICYLREAGHDPACCCRLACIRAAGCSSARLR